MKKFFGRLIVFVFLLPLVGMVFVGRWVNKIFDKDNNPFKISEAEAQDSCWTPPSCGDSCASCDGGCGCASGATGSSGAGGAGGTDGC